MSQLRKLRCESRYRPRSLPDCPCTRRMEVSNAKFLGELRRTSISSIRFTRSPGIGNVQVCRCGPNYAMRLWVTRQLASWAITSRNRQRLFRRRTREPGGKAGGRTCTRPEFTYSVLAAGRVSLEEFGQIVLSRDARPAEWWPRSGTYARIELGSRN